MIISQLIKQLKEHQDEHGDVETEISIGGTTYWIREVEPVPLLGTKRVEVAINACEYLRR